MSLRRKSNQIIHLDEVFFVGFNYTKHYILLTAHKPKAKTLKQSLIDIQVI
jgi:hypothetical protein